MLEILTTHTYLLLLLGTTLMGTSSAMAGSFLYLKRQGIMADVIAHATLPGIMLSFLLGVLLFSNGRNLSLLTVGAIITGVIATVLVIKVKAKTPLGSQNAMAATISLFFSIGLLVLAYIQQSAISGKGGIGDYLFGNAAHLTREDLLLNTVTAGAAVFILVARFRFFSITVFDPVFAKANGINTGFYEKLLFFLLTATIVSGMRSVGLLLITAFILIPVAAARQWCKSLRATVLLAAIICSGSAILGTYISVKIWQVPTGALTVLLLTLILFASLLFAPQRGIISRVILHLSTKNHTRIPA